MSGTSYCRTQFWGNASEPVGFGWVNSPVQLWAPVCARVVVLANRLVARFRRVNGGQQ
jgi:hypothetical protein